MQINYDWGIGFFTIKVLSYLEKGLNPFIQNNENVSKIRIITLVKLAPEERMTIQKRGETLTYEKK